MMIKKIFDLVDLLKMSWGLYTLRTAARGDRAYRGGIWSNLQPRKITGTATWKMSWMGSVWREGHWGQCSRRDDEGPEPRERP